MERQPPKRYERGRKHPKLYGFALAMLAITSFIGGCSPQQPATSPTLCETTEGFKISCDDMPKDWFSEAIHEFFMDVKLGGLSNGLQYQGRDPNPPIKQLFQRLIPDFRPVPQWNSRLKEGFRQWIEKILSGDQKTVTETNKLIDDVTDGFPTLGLPESLPDMNH